MNGSRTNATRRARPALDYLAQLVEADRFVDAIGVLVMGALDGRVAHVEALHEILALTGRVHRCLDFAVVADV